MTRKVKLQPIRMSKKYITKMLRDDIFGLAAEMAFYLLTAFFPSVILLFIIATTVSESMQNLLFGLIHALPAEAEDIIMNMLLGFSGSLPIIITAGVFALWCMSNVIGTITKALNRFYETRENRGFVRMKLINLFFALLIIATVVLSFALVIFGEGVGRLLQQSPHLNFLNTEVVWNRVRYLTIILVFLVAITAIFKVLPNKKLPVGSLVVGSSLTAAAWYIASWGFSFYVNNFSRYHVIYGSLAGIVILITWIYMTGFVILAGGELNALIYKTRKARRLHSQKKKHRRACADSTEV